MRFQTNHTCQQCGKSVNDDFVKRFWHSKEKQFRAFMGRCGVCFDSMRFTWGVEDREEEHEHS